MQSQKARADSFGILGLILELLELFVFRVSGSGTISGGGGECTFLILHISVTAADRLTPVIWRERDLPLTWLLFSLLSELYLNLSGENLHEPNLP